MLQHHLNIPGINLFQLEVMLDNLSKDNIVSGKDIELILAYERELDLLN